MPDSKTAGVIAAGNKRIGVHVIIAYDWLVVSVTATIRNEWLIVVTIIIVNIAVAGRNGRAKLADIVPTGLHISAAVRKAVIFAAIIRSMSGIAGDGVMEHLQAAVVDTLVNAPPVTSSNNTVFDGDVIGVHIKRAGHAHTINYGIVGVNGDVAAHVGITRTANGTGVGSIWKAATVRRVCTISRWWIAGWATSARRWW